MPNITSDLLQIVNLEEGANDNTWGPIADANWEKLETAIAGVQGISSTGGTTTLTDDEARAGVIYCVGTLTADHIIEVPDHSKWWIIRNLHTLGAYALKMKIPSGTAVSIPASPTASLVYCDGTDIHVLGTNIPNARMATMADNTMKGNLSGGVAAPQDVSISDLAEAVGAFPAGTRMLFQQTAAPTGWTKDTGHNDKALRIVSGTAGTGGAVAFSVAFAAQTPAGTVGNTTLTENQIPAHTHFLAASSSDSGGILTASNQIEMDYSVGSSPDYLLKGVATAATIGKSGSTGGGAAHNHTFTGDEIDLEVAYVDVIIAQKD